MKFKEGDEVKDPICQNKKWNDKLCKTKNREGSALHLHLFYSYDKFKMRCFDQSHWVLVKPKKEKDCKCQKNIDVCRCPPKRLKRCDIYWAEVNPIQKCQKEFNHKGKHEARILW